MQFGRLDDAPRQELRWLRVPHGAREFHLLDGETLIGTLTWAREHGSLAVAETADRRWSFKRSGYLPGHLTARHPGDERDLARLSSEIHARGIDHWIDIGGNRRYDLRRLSAAVPAWQMLLLSGEEIAHIEAVRDGPGLAGGAVIVTIPASPRATWPLAADLPLLLMFSWYFVVLGWAEEALVSEWVDHTSGRF